MWPTSSCIVPTPILLNQNPETLKQKIDIIKEYIVNNKEKLKIAELCDRNDRFSFSSFSRAFLCNIRFRKSDTVANDWKEKGNNYFAQKKYEDAVKCYTKVIQYSNYTSQLIAFGYANRSASYFYLKDNEKALYDIEDALESNTYPTDKIYKLYQRRGLIHLNLLNYNLSINDFDIAIQHYTTSNNNNTHELNNKNEDFILLNKYKTSAIEQQSKNNNNNNNSDNIKNIGAYTLNEEEKEEEEEDKYNENKEIGNASNKVTVKYEKEEEGGRKLISKQQIEEGEIIIIERPYASCLLRAFSNNNNNNNSYHNTKTNNNKCHYCFEAIKRSKMCERCTNAIYCSIKCRQLADKYYHVIECGLNLFQTAPTTVVLACRLLFRKINELVNSNSQIDNNNIQFESNIQLENKKKGINPNTNRIEHCGVSVDSLQTHIDVYPPLELIDIIFNSLIVTLSLQYEIQIDVFQLINHLCQIRTNVYANYELMNINKNNNNSNSKNNSSVEQVRIGESMYITSSLINHSCNANTMIQHKGNKIIIRAIETIKEGKEITHCYGPHVSRMSTIQRQTILLNTYFFTCKCDSCCDTQINNRSYICDICIYPLTSSINNSNQLTCKKCNKVYDIEIYKKKEEESNTLLNTALHEIQKIEENDNDNFTNEYINDIINLLLKSLEIRKKIMYKYNPSIGEVYDSLAHIYALINDLSNSIHYIDKSISIVKLAFGE